MIERVLRVIAATFFLTFAIQGCATFNHDLPTVVADVSEATLVVSTIESFVNAWFANHPNPSVQATVDGAIAKVKEAAAAVLAAGRGAGDLSNSQGAAAIAEFETTYNDLLALVKSFGVNVGPLGPVGAKRLALVPRAGLTVPAAKDLRLVARR